MDPAIDPRRLIALSVLATACLLVASAISADEPQRDDERTIRQVADEPRLLDNEDWFAHVFAAEAESPSDRTVPQITVPPDPAPETRPRVDPREDPVLAPIVRPTIDNDSQPPIVAAPNIAAPGVAPTDEPRFTLFRRSRSRASFARRRRPIAVLGDSLTDTGQMNLQYTVLDKSTWPATPMAASASIDIPLTAAATRRRISKNSSVLPTDRLILSYHHFHNALAVETAHPIVGDTRNILNLDRMTIGFEKTFFDGQWAIDVRLPAMSRFDTATTDFTLTNGRLGNTSLLLKHLWYETDAMALGVGVGIDTPTGSDGHVVLPNAEVVVANDAYHALPYLGLLFTPTDNCVVQAFAQLDIPLNGNEIEVFTPSNGSFIGQFDERELLFLSLSAAHWLYQNPDASYLKGLAALLELHHTTSLDDSDRVTINALTNSYNLRDSANAYNNLNMAMGVQAQIGMTEFRAAAVLPLLDGANRPFDAEFLLQINRRY
ncbi:MAG: hypothetical protein CMJ50_06395 [Planctomycetaceae bacterium]|nr:hypothetical protein [Planctomycetaceae bacterium]